MVVRFCFFPNQCSCRGCYLPDNNCWSCVGCGHPGTAQAAAQLPSVERVECLVERVERLVERVERLVERVERLVERVERLVERVERLAERVERLVERVERLAERVVL